MHIRPKAAVVSPSTPTPPSPAPAKGAETVPPPPALAPKDTFEPAKGLNPVVAALGDGRIPSRGILTEPGKGGLAGGDLAAELEKRRTQRPDRIGTTGRPGLPTWEDPSEPPRSGPGSPDPYRINGGLHGQGTRIGTGEAAGKKHGHDPVKPVDLHQPWDPNAPSEEWNRRMLQETERLLNFENHRPPIDSLDPYWAEKPKVNPNPEAPIEGGWVPKHGPPDPYLDWLNRPHLFDPAVDPRLEEPTGPSSVLRQRGQAVDPYPDADPDAEGARRALLSTADGVTDPTPELGALDRLAKEGQP